MKNRKLFAILTLVAFMMTLLPMAAFAADRSASIVNLKDAKVEANGKKEAEFTVYLYDNGFKEEKGGWVYVASERGTTDFIYPKAGSVDEWGFVDENGTYTKAASNAIVKDADGKITDITGQEEVVAFKAKSTSNKIEFRMASKVPGDAEVAIGLTDKVYKYLTDSNTTVADAQLLKNKTYTVTFEAGKTNNIVFTNVEPRSGSAAVPVKVNPGEYTASPTLMKGNGVDYYEVKVKVTNSSGAPVEDETVKFSLDKNGAELNKEEAKTDAVGEAKVKVYATEPDTYELEARVGSKSATLSLEFLAGDANNLSLESDVDELVAIDHDRVDSFKIKLSDINGNKANPKAIDIKEIVEFEWITEPSGSDLDDEWAFEGYDVDGWKANGYAGSDSDTTYLKVTNDKLLQVWLPELTEEGKYLLRVSIGSGKYVDIEFEAREQGDIAKITLEYDQSALGLNSKSSAPTVKRVDAAGVSLEVDNYSQIEFSVNDFRKLHKNYRDLNVTGSNRGVIYTTDDPDYTGTLVITAVDTKEKFSATYTMEIGAEAIGFDIEVADELYAVGEETPVYVVLKDANGNQVAAGDVTVDFQYYVTNKPADARATASKESKFADNIKEKGKAAVDVVSNKAGDVTYTFVVKLTDDNGDVITLSQSAKVTFGVPVEKVTYGVKNLTMFIGSTGFVADGNAGTMDQAPFIQDNRTFVPLRAVATALGATNEDTMWDPATQTITLVRPDLTVTMTIGSNVLTLSDGSTVVADVAPFIVAETGRTVIPFRAIAEAFGADVEAVFGADGTTTAVTFTQE